MIFYKFSFLDFERCTRTKYKFNFIKIGGKSLIHIDCTTEDREIYIELLWFPIYRRYWNVWACSSMDDVVPLVVEWFGRKLRVKGGK